MSSDSDRQYQLDFCINCGAKVTQQQTHCLSCGNEVSSLFKSPEEIRNLDILEEPLPDPDEELDKQPWQSPLLEQKLLFFGMIGLLAIVTGLIFYLVR